MHLYSYSEAQLQFLNMLDHQQEFAESIDARKSFLATSEIKAVAVLLYYTLSLLSARAITPGMSYCDLQFAHQVYRQEETSSVPLVEPSSSSGRLLASCMFALMTYTFTKLPTCLRFAVEDLSAISDGSKQTIKLFNPMSNSWHPRELSDSQRAARLVGFINDIHIWLFFAYGAYLDFPLRITRLRMLTSANRPQTRLDQVGNLLSKLHFLKLLLHSIAGLTGLLITIQRFNGDDKSESILQAHGETTSDEKTTISEKSTIIFPFDRTCTLCHGRIESPAALTCGHIFCWGCLQSWKAAAPPSSSEGTLKTLKCPLCTRVCISDNIRPIFLSLHE
jgi:hypothetical protein